MLITLLRVMTQPQPKTRIMKHIPILAVLCAVTLHSLAQQPGSGDPFVKDGSPAPAPAPADPNNVSQLPAECVVRMEVFTLSLADGRRVMRQFPKQADLYAWLGAELEKEKPAVKLEKLALLRVRGGQRSKLEEIAEYPYPTEFYPPQIPQVIGLGLPVDGGSHTTITNPAPVPAPPAPPAPTPPTPAPGAKGDPGAPGAPAAVVAPGSMPAGMVFGPWPYTTTTPTSFAMRNTGWTAEIEVTLGEDGETVDINMAPELVKLCGLASQSPSGEMMQPTFETSKISAQIITTLGQPTLAGTFSPPVGTGVEGGNTENVTRLLFLTVTDPR